MKTELALIIALTLTAAAGCSSMNSLATQVGIIAPITDTVTAEQPMIAPEPNLGGEETLLDYYLRVYRDYLQEKSRAAALETELDGERTKRVSAEDQATKLRAEVTDLGAKAQRLEVISAKYDEAQAQLLKYEDQMRELRRQLLEEKVARVRSEQTLVALKIERVRAEQRKSEMPNAPANEAADNAETKAQEEK